MESETYLDPAKTYKNSQRICEICLEARVKQRIHVVCDGDIIEHYDICDSNLCFETLQDEVVL